jgi:hypothetical protein
VGKGFFRMAFHRDGLEELCAHDRPKTRPARKPGCGRE